MSAKDDILKMLGALTEVYQDVWLSGQKIADGKRDCESRWDMIAPLIKPNSVILDIGSSLGFFALKIAQREPSCLVVSFESMENHAQIQRRLCEEQGIYNVIVCQHRLGVDDLEKWTGCVELIDTILILSVLHHFRKEDVWPAFRAFTSMAPCVIAEMPNPEETVLCGGETLDVIGDIAENGTLLGRVKSHLEDKFRAVMSFEQGVSRGDIDAYMGVDHEGRNKFDVVGDSSGWMLNGKGVIPGINAWNLLHFSPVWPMPSWWRSQAERAYASLEHKSDVRPWNLLATASGLRAIDYTTEFPQDDVATFHPEDMVKLDEVFACMKPINPWAK